MKPFGIIERNRSEYPNQPKEAVMLRETPPRENKLTRIITTFDPDVPGWLFWTVFIVMALLAMTFIK
jgi:hypothetical protein